MNEWPLMNQSKILSFNTKHNKWISTFRYADLLYLLFVPLDITNTAWKVSKYGVIFGPYFLVFGLNTEIYCKSPYSVQMQENTGQKYFRIWRLFTYWDLLYLLFAF